MATKYIRNEFKTIIELTDQDEMHKSILNEMPQNLCRYKKIFPYKDNTVSIPTENKGINASWVHIPTEKSFIMTQAPVEDTIDDFWAMCFQYNVNMIIMLCNIIEDQKEKSTVYWDTNKLKKFKINNIEIIEENDIIIIKKIEIINLKDSSTKNISHLQFKKWPDHMTPDIQNVVHIFENIFNYMNENNNFVKQNIQQQNNPIVIHCSAGVGRSGVFLTLYFLYKEIMDCIKDSKELIEFNIFNLVRKLKELRMYSVENINQYNFIYYFISELLNEKNYNINYDNMVNN